LTRPVVVENKNSIYNKLEPVFSQAHTGFAPIKVDDVAEGVRQVLQQNDTVTNIEYHPVKNFKEVSGALERIKVLSPNIDISMRAGKDMFIANIYYNATDNYCWERFSKVKELCQIIIGCDCTRISKFNRMKEFIRYLVAPYMRKFGALDMVEAVEIDELGILAACEVLFPMRDRHYYIENQSNPETRQQVINMIQAQDPFDADHWDGTGPRNKFDENATFAELLAFAYRIPKLYVETLLVDDTSYNLWRMARDENPARFGNVTQPPKRS
jgi:hypothetical protein